MQGLNYDICSLRFLGIIPYVNHSVIASPCFFVWINGMVIGNKSSEHVARGTKKNSYSLICISQQISLNVCTFLHFFLLEIEIKKKENNLVQFSKYIVFFFVIIMRLSHFIIEIFKYKKNIILCIIILNR